MLPTTTKAVYVAKPEYINELCRELTNVTHVVENLVFSTEKKRDVCFALDVWLDPVIVNFTSISEAARILRQAGKLWSLYPISNVRRSHLIANELRKLPSLQHSFPIIDPIPAIGSFSLLDKNTMIYSAKRWKKPPLGHFQFIEDKVNPPNRAYLKLWEALSLLNHLPRPGELAVDLGASPGGWSYVMQTLGTRVIAIDKAPLETRIARLPNIQYLQQSAFAFEPNNTSEPIDWLLSDVACYPERLYPFVMKWIESTIVKQFIFTLKLQGETNLDIIRQFQAIPGSRVVHLYQNKHEVTFFYPAPRELFVAFEEANTF